MTYTTYVDGDGIKKNRKVRGEGSVSDPHEGVVYDADMNAALGAPTSTPATNTTGTWTLISLLKGLWTAFGLQSQASDTTGTLMQRIRGIVDRVGSFGDPASATGSIMAQLRKIAESDVLPRANNPQYYASFAGGNKSYNATPGAVDVAGTGGNVCVFINPAASGVDLYIQRLVLSSDNAGRYERYRQGTLGTPGTPAVGVNRGGNGTTGIGKVYPPAQLTATGGNISMVTYVPASATSSDAVDGTLILRPGQNLYWRYLPNGNIASKCAVEVVWWELSAQA
jgi:hypothetical protein